MMTLTFTTVVAHWPHLFMKAAIVVPEEVASKLPSGRIRVEGTVNGVPFALAIQRTKDGTRYLATSAALRKAASIEVGQPVSVACTIVDPDKLHVPEELQALLDVDDDARTVWETLTRGAQRGLAHYVNGAKSTDARVRRAIDIMRKAVNGELHMQRSRTVTSRTSNDRDS